MLLVLKSFELMIYLIHVYVQLTKKITSTDVYTSIFKKYTSIYTSLIEQTMQTVYGIKMYMHSGSQAPYQQIPLVAAVHGHWGGGGGGGG